MKQLSDAAKLLIQSQHVVFFTGAGLSADSGIPTFRNRSSGIWSNIRPEDIATPHAFMRNPIDVWKWHIGLLETMQNAAPNAGHLALAKCQELVTKVSVITQNIDGLHQRAGSTDVTELHGNIFRVKGFCDIATYLATHDSKEIPPRCPVCNGCTRNQEDWDIYCDDIDLNALPRVAEELRCPYCSGWLRPDIVWFTELLPPSVLEYAWRQIDNCDLLISVGASLKVTPAADMPLRAKRNGAALIEINPERTAVTEIADVSFRTTAAQCLTDLIQHAAELRFNS